MRNQKTENRNTAIHKEHWIRVLKDETDTREVKKAFLEELLVEGEDGEPKRFTCPLEAAKYLEEAEEEWFIGEWFVTDARLNNEIEADLAGKASVFTIGPMDNLINAFTQVPKDSFDDWFKYRDGLLSSVPETFLNMLVQLFAWAEEGHTNNKRARQAQMIICVMAECDNEEDFKTVVAIALGFVDLESQGDWLEGTALGSNKNILA